MIFAGFIFIISCNSKKNTTEGKDLIQDHTDADKLIADTFFTASGTEPFWAVYAIRTTSGDTLVVFQPAEGDLIEMEPNWINIFSKDSILYNCNDVIKELLVKAKKQECSNGMNEIIYPYSVEVFVEGKKFTGCGKMK
jgi:uncharacterized membrane protein